MTEKLLQYIWQFRYFNLQELVLETGESLQILFAGQPNNDQGPDFLDARIKIGNTVWVGHIELHLQSSGWVRHAHDLDPNYNSVILHVVWQNDLPGPGRNIPVLILQNRVSKLLLHRYEEWMQDRHFVPCQNQVQELAPLVWIHWKERLVVERLQRKTQLIQSWLEESRNHWEEVFWWLIARNFGLKINADAFEAMARSLPLTQLARYKNKPVTLEALLFGQCGLLEPGFTDPYPLLLKKEYRFQQSKFHCRPIPQPIHFLRMRPINFPTIRLSQLAALIGRSSHLFSSVRDAHTINELKSMITVKAGPYWDNHYVFEEISSASDKSLGMSMIGNIQINTVVPMVFAFGCITGEKKFMDRAIDWLKQIPAEQNTIIRNWKQLGLECDSASDTQALLELKSKYCNWRRCLACSVGNSLLKRIAVVTING